MSKPSSAVKRKYNKGAYRRYEFSVGVDKKLNYYLEDYKKNGGNVSDLVKTLLAKHFDIEREENFFPFRYDEDGNIMQAEYLKMKE